MNQNFNLVLILGAGASKPLGLPVSREMVKEFLDTKDAEPLGVLKEKIITEDWDIEKLIRLIQQISTLDKEPPLKEILEKAYSQRLEKKILKLNGIYDGIYINLLQFVRRRCLKPDISKAIDLYEPLIKLKEKLLLKIFTTNYDTSIEDVCKHLQIEFNDGFDISPFDDNMKFHPEILGKKNPQLYKIHGSVNWWADEKREGDIFRLGLELEGLKNISNMMIYPAQLELTYNYPFNIMQSHYVLSLIESDMVVAIGHKFGDINISLPIKALLERPKFKLHLISPSAENIKRDVFKDHNNVIAIPKKIEDWITDGLNEINNEVESFEKRVKEEEEKENKILEKIRKERLDLKLSKRSPGKIIYTLDTNGTLQYTQVTCPKCGGLIATYYGSVPPMYECKVCNIHFQKSELETSVKFE